MANELVKPKSRVLHQRALTARYNKVAVGALGGTEWVVSRRYAKVRNLEEFKNRAASEFRQRNRERRKRKTGQREKEQKQRIEASRTRAEKLLGTEHGTGKGCRTNEGGVADRGGEN
jgi:hypothetical protein